MSWHRIAATCVWHKKTNCMKKLIYYFAALICLAACNAGGDDDGGNGGGGTQGGGGGTSGTTPTYADTLASKATYELMQQHSVGNGFPVVLMADGYTKAEITSGKYKAAMEKAQAALFAIEPMKSLEKYVDVIGVTVPSNESGVTQKKHDTALRTYLASGEDTNVFGDSVAVMGVTWHALINIYGLTTAEATQRLNSTLTIVMPNTDAYKGVTVLYIDKAVKDSIPSGFSLSYVPAYAKANGVDMFKTLIQHEAVGHGIAKLADEYHYGSTAVTTKVVADYEEGQRCGFYLNTRYVSPTLGSAPIYEVGPDSWLYPIKQRDEYSGEDLKWYRGAFVFATAFYRCSDHSIMNVSNDPLNVTFNVASRAMVYKRVMRTAYGAAWQWKLSEFIGFDAPSRKDAAAAKAKAAYVFTAPSVADIPMLAAPRVVDMKYIAK